MNPKKKPTEQPIGYSSVVFKKIKLNKIPWWKQLILFFDLNNSENCVVKKILILLVVVVLCVAVFAADFSLYPVIDGYPTQEIVSANFAMVYNSSTSPTLCVLFGRDGSIRQLEDASTTETLPARKFAVITKTNLQIESVNESELVGAKIYNRQWQIPKGTSMLVTHYKEIGGIPDFDNPMNFVVTPTSGTLMIVRWIRSDFTPYNILVPLIEDGETTGTP